MEDLKAIWPPFGLEARSGDLELSPVREADLPELAEAARSGVSPAGVATFPVRWDRQPPAEVARSLARYHWGVRTETTAEKWSLEFTVRRAGRVVGVQAVMTEGFVSTRVGSTGSWLALPHQGQGTGTRMRQVAAAVFFDSFGAVELYSSYLAGNEASRRVSEKCGYRPNGRRRIRGADGHPVSEMQMVLTPDTFVRPRDPIEVTGADACAEFLGIDTGLTASSRR